MLAHCNRPLHSARPSGKIAAVVTLSFTAHSLQQLATELRTSDSSASRNAVAAFARRRARSKASISGDNSSGGSALAVRTATGPCRCAALSHKQTMNQSQHTVQPKQPTPTAHRPS